MSYIFIYTLYYYSPVTLNNWRVSSLENTAYKVRFILHYYVKMWAKMCLINWGAMLVGCKRTFTYFVLKYGLIHVVKFI